MKHLISFCFGLIIALFGGCQNQPPPTIVKQEVQKTPEITLNVKEKYDASRNSTINWYEATMLLIKKWEGYSQSTYLCQANVETVGWGFTKPELDYINKLYNKSYKMSDFLGTKPSGLSQEVLKLCVDYRTEMWKKRFPHLTANEIGTLVSISFNVGDNAIGNSSLMKKLTIKDEGERIRQVCKTLMSFNKVTITVKYLFTKKKKVIESKGLTNRREDECRLYKGDVSPYTLKLWREQVINTIKKNS